MKALFLLLFVSPLLCFAQHPDMPLVEGKITYEQVVRVDSATSQSDLFARSREWFAKTYRSANNVIQLEDKENGKIVGKGVFSVTGKSMGTTYDSGIINYTITVQAKDGRYKYTLENFYHEKAGSKAADSFGPCERFFNGDEKMYGMKMRKWFDSYLTQMDTHVKGIIASLATAMGKPASAKKDEW
jgi:hypothetical protein